MCGIVGISSGTEFDFNKIEEATERMSHRGPDDHGHLIDEDLGIAIGHRRLAIMDTSSSGHQPMYDAKKRVAIVFNGEIYNFPQLRKELEAKGYVFHGRSDTEVILNLYLEKGEEMLSLINGIFAFAIVDISKKSVLLARDALGVKPLYYSQTKGSFAFASEIKSLLHVMDSPSSIDIHALEKYLTFLWCPGEATPVKEIKKFKPGTAMWICRGMVEKEWQWYQLPIFSGKKIPNVSTSTIINEVRYHLKQAVRRQMISDVPVGAFLSGGLDSSAIVAMAKDIQPDIRCFTIDTQSTGNNEQEDDLPYAKRVARHLDVPLEVVSVSSSQMALDVEAMIYQLDEPLADPASLNVLYISRLARQNGIKVLLSGAGGDDLFTGYRRHLALRFEHYWRWLPTKFLNFLGNKTSQLDQRNPFLRRLSKVFSGAGLEGDEKLVHYFRWIRRNDLIPLFSLEWRKHLEEQETSFPMIDFLNGLPHTVLPMERMLALEQRFFLTDHNLIYTDKMSMAEGVEVRVPFLDLDLVKCSYSIPARLKQKGREGKWILKKAMESYLPRDVIYRPKSGFGAPLRHWMRHELRDLLGGFLGEESLRNRGIFDPEAVSKLIESNDSGRIDGSYTLFSILSIEIWCRRFLDRNGSESDIKSDTINLN